MLALKILFIKKVNRSSNADGYKVYRASKTKTTSKGLACNLEISKSKLDKGMGNPNEQMMGCN